MHGMRLNGNAPPRPPGGLVILAGALALFGAACDDCRLRFLNTTVPQGQVGVPYEAVLDVSCDEVDTFTVLSGEVPPGLAVAGRESSALLYGTPLVAGDYTFQLEAARYGDTDDFTGEPEPPSLAVVSVFVRINATTAGAGQDDAAGGVGRDATASASEEAAEDESGAAGESTPSGEED